MKFYIHFYEKSNFQFKDSLILEWKKSDSTLKELLQNITNVMPQVK